MDYSMTVNGMVIELPKYTFDIAEKIERQEIVNSGTSKFKDKCKSMYATICSIIGDDKVSDAIGTFNETDPNLINIMYLELIKAYNKPIEEFNQNKLTDSLQNSGVEDITKLLNSLQNIDKLKGFK